MTEQAHADYFASRERLERSMSERAIDARVAAAHTEMADRYQALALVFGAKPTAEADGEQGTI